MATKRAKSSKKVEDLDPKERSADVKGGRKNLLSDRQRRILQRGTRKVINTVKDVD